MGILYSNRGYLDSLYSNRMILRVNCIELLLNLNFL